MNVWIKGAQRGMEAEMLSHFIVAYAAMAEMTPPPALFAELTKLKTYDAARAAISKKLAQLDASGAVPEGGGTWAAFIARTGAEVKAMARAYDAGETPKRASREQAAAWIRTSVLVTELWLADEK